MTTGQQQIFVCLFVCLFVLFVCCFLGGMHFSIYVLLILMCVIYLADHHFIMKNDVNTHFLLCQRCGPGLSTAVSSALGSSNLKPVSSTIKFLIICKHQNNAFTCLYILLALTKSC